jgi:hypothetical protein
MTTQTGKCDHPAGRETQLLYIHKKAQKNSSGLGNAFIHYKERKLSSLFYAA